MKTSIKNLKKQAKETYHNQLSDLMVIQLLYSVGLNVVSLLSVTMGAYVAYGPLEYGLYKANYMASQDEDVSAATLLDGFKYNFGDSFLVGLIRLLIKAVPKTLLFAHILVIIASIASTTISLGWLSFEVSKSTLMLSYFVLVLLLVVDIISIVLRYAFEMAQYILIRNPGIEPLTALKASGRLMKGHKFRLFRMKLSFIGWFLFALCTASLSNIYSGPYMTAAKIQMFNEIYENNLKAQL